jgi:hypothetical protein
MLFYIRGKHCSSRIHILPATYDDILVYQQTIDELRADLPRIQRKFPLIDEQMALLVRYEINIETNVCIERNRIVYSHRSKFYH